MKKLSFVALAFPVLLSAQTVADCRLQTQDACQKAEDIYTYLFPQLGASLAAGNPVLGSTRMLGGLGHFSVGVRAAAIKSSIPKFDEIDVSLLGKVSSDIPLKEQWLPVPVFDAAVGVYGGIPVGVTHIGAIDALASLTVVPKVIDEEDIKIDGTTKFGFGVQVGLLEESIVVPGISFAYLQRGIPQVNFSTNANTPATFAVNDLDVKVSTWRLIASKNLMLFGISAGIGGDSYKSEGVLRASAAGFSEQIPLDRTVTRPNWFVDLTLNAGPVKIAGEYGSVGKKTLDTFNHFDPEAGASRSYFSAGLRIKF